VAPAPETRTEGKERVKMRREVDGRAKSPGRALPNHSGQTPKGTGIGKNGARKRMPKGKGWHPGWETKTACTGSGSKPKRGHTRLWEISECAGYPPKNGQEKKITRTAAIQ